MSEQRDPEVAPEVALGRFLTAIQTQADMDPQFRSRLVLALGVTVVFAGEDDLSTVEPHILAVHKTELQFRAIYGKLTVTKLRPVLTKSGLASTADVRGKSQGELIEMLWTRAADRAEERGLTPRR